MKTFFDITIRSSSYSFQDKVKPNTSHRAFDTFEKIEQILDKNLTYLNNSHSNYTPTELIQLLEKKSAFIYQKYTSKLFWFQKIFIRRNKVNQIYNRIQIKLKRADPINLFEGKISSEVILKVLKHLDISDIVAFGKTNDLANQTANLALLKKAQKFGYIGHNLAEAKKYLKELLQEIKILFRIKIIPQQFIAYQEKQKGLHLKKILENIQNAAPVYLFKMFSNPDFYSPSFQKFRKLLHSKLNWKVPESDYSQEIKVLAEKALIMALKNGNKNILKILLKFKGNIDAQDEESNTLLMQAFNNSKIDIAKYLIKKGANVNLPNKKGILPLFKGIWLGSFEICNLLINAGADKTLNKFAVDQFNAVKLICSQLVTFLNELNIKKHYFGISTHSSFKLLKIPTNQALLINILKIYLLLKKNNANDFPEKYIGLFETCIYILNNQYEKPIIT